MSEYESCCRIIPRILLLERRTAVLWKEMESLLGWVVVVEDHPLNQTGLVMFSNIFLALICFYGKTGAQFINLIRCS